jgi:membrane associated rhomboid family serine protease
MNLGEELKQAWNRPNNGLIQLIIINVVVFVLMVLLLVISKFSGADRIFEVVYNQFALPGSIEKFIYKPWTIITYAFTHSLSGILHILFNMLIFLLVRSGICRLPGQSETDQFVRTGCYCGRCYLYAICQPGAY